MQNNEQYKSLIDMGCSPILSEAAIKNTKSQDIMVLLDWISANEEKEDHWKEWLATHANESTQAEKKVEGDVNIPIQTLINNEHCQQLIKKGHSKLIAQKALVLSNNMGVGMAQKWIEDHKYDPDFEEQLIITGSAEQKPKMTPEQAKQRLKELTEKARLIKKQRQEEDNLAREKNRMRSGKQMVEAKRIAEEQAAKRQIELDRIQKAKDEAYKQQLIEQMRREKNERLGIKTEETKNVTAPKKEEPKYTKTEQVELQCEQVKVGNHAYPEKAKIFFETANIYVNNIIKNNGEQKFRKINKQNKAFQGRIAEAFGGVECLMVIGYEQDGNFLFMRQFDLKELGDISKILQRYASYYG